jgi:hypothetical protein
VVPATLLLILVLLYLNFGRLTETFIVMRRHRCLSRKRGKARLASLSAGGLKKLNQVARRIDQKDLPSPRSGHNVISEAHTGYPQPRDLAVNVINDEVNAIPAARLWLLAIRHRPPSGAGGTAEQQSEGAAPDIREGWRGIGEQLEGEVPSIPGHGGVDIVDHVSNVDSRIRHALPPLSKLCRTTLVACASSRSRSCIRLDSRFGPSAGPLPDFADQFPQPQPRYVKAFPPQLGRGV